MIDFMFRMRFQIINQPVYQPPVPNIQIQPVINPYLQPQPLPLAITNPVVLGNIFGAMYSRGPCTSCGSK